MEFLYQGDIDCDGDVDLDDFELLILYASGLWDGVSGLNGCPSVNQAEPITGFPWGDVNCDGLVNALDVLFILAYQVDIDLTPVEPSCVPVGNLIT